jgi:hypothetical protein
MFSPPKAALSSGLIVSGLLLGCSSAGPEKPMAAPENGRPIRVDLYSSVDECRRAGRLSRERCEQGARQALSRHPRFAEKWSDRTLCRAAHGVDCTRYAAAGRDWWSARPIGFLACFPEDGQCPALRFAPVYFARDFGEYTGQGGGRLARPSRRGSTAAPTRREIGVPLRRQPSV